LNHEPKLKEFEGWGRLSVTNLVAVNGSTELFETLLQSDSMLEVCRKFLFSDLNDFSHTIFVCSFSDRGLVKIEHSQGKTADEFTPPEDIWKSDFFSEALRGNKYVHKAESLRTLHILPLLHNDLAIGSLILIGERGSEIRDELQSQLRLVQLLGGYFLTQHLESKFRSGGQAAPGDLSSRQLAILEHVCNSLTNAQIATRLHVSLSTVGQELMKIYRYLGVANRNEACAAVRKSAQQAKPNDSDEEESSNLSSDSELIR
jgi:DNA-binding CsgD family transcriptional regulator